MKCISMLLMVIASSFLRAEEAPPTPLALTGMVTLDGETRVSLVDPQSGAASGWLGRGQSFQGFKVEGYSAVNSAVTLKKQGSTFVVTMTPPRVLAPTSATDSRFKVEGGRLSFHRAKVGEVVARVAAASKRKATVSAHLAEFQMTGKVSVDDLDALIKLIALAQPVHVVLANDGSVYVASKGAR
ncbi:MAG: hypothetical protein JNN01_11875 [Opitutaceae bacterium]|nr:hypothetical protein [Opitutaceae bacterium]